MVPEHCVIMAILSYIRFIAAPILLNPRAPSFRFGGTEVARDPFLLGPPSLALFTQKSLQGGFCRRKLSGLIARIKGSDFRVQAWGQQSLLFAY